MKLLREPTSTSSTKGRPRIYRRSIADCYEQHHPCSGCVWSQATCTNNRRMCNVVRSTTASLALSPGERYQKSLSPHSVMLSHHSGGSSHHLAGSAANWKTSSMTCEGSAAIGRYVTRRTVVAILPARNQLSPHPTGRKVTEPSLILFAHTDRSVTHTAGTQNETERTKEDGRKQRTENDQSDIPVRTRCTLYGSTPDMTDAIPLTAMPQPPASNVRLTW